MLEEKYLKLSKPLQILTISLCFIISVISFVVCAIIKSNSDNIVWEIVMTCVGMFFGILTTCLAIYLLITKKQIDNKKA